MSDDIIRIAGTGSELYQEERVPPSKLNIRISAPNMAVLQLRLVGTAPYVQNRFSEKALAAMRAAQEAGTKAKSRVIRMPRDFEADFLAAQHVAREGWVGMPAAAFRNAAIDVCRLVGFKMTLAKLSLFVEADGYDSVDGTPLVRIEGRYVKTEMPLPNDNGSYDIRVRPMWWPGWEALLRVRFDSDQFSAQDVTNLVMRIGEQCGVGAGRPFSKNSAGCGWGLFRLAEAQESAEVISA